MNNSKNGTIKIVGILTVIILLLGLLHTMFIRPLQKEIDELKIETADKTADRWTKGDEKDARDVHDRVHDKLDERIEKCCQQRDNR